jgi:FAD/FMN-containing dehydrogenase
LEIDELESPSPRAADAPMIDQLLATLQTRVPSLTLTREAEELAQYGRDWTKVHTPAPSLVAFPRTREEVQALLAACNDLGIAVVPSGGRTGLAAGAVAAKGEVVLSLDKMRHMGEVDVLGGTVRVEAGAITAAVHEHCEKHGLTWPVDFASKGSSSIGGNIATNAGGVKVIRYGLTRQWVLGLEVVLADGTFLELNGALEKNNTGVDLRQLFIGSEGILGVITAATLKLAPVPKKLDVFLFGVRDLAAVLTLFREARKGPFTVSAFEFFTQGCLDRVRKHRNLRPPFDEPTSHYVLLEVEHGDAESLESWLTSLFERELVHAGTMAQHDREARDLWQLREGISESLSATGLPHKNDIALPIARLEAFCAELDAIFAANYPGFDVLLFGHIGDGNLHVNVMKPDAMEKAEFLAHAKKSDVHMFELVKKHQGSISAEHGVGLLKRDFLHYSRTPAELVLLKALKLSLDPKNTLNPGKVIDVAAS